MPFQKGQSGCPGGRPKTAKSLRVELIRRYGNDGGPLVQRLEDMSNGRDRKIAIVATELLLAYHSGKPTQSMDLNANVAVEPLRVVIDAPSG